MSETLTQSLWITLLSMGLVFTALVLLAGLMSAMTRLFRERESLTPNPSPEGRGAVDEGNKARAAALAVAVALAEQSQSTARPITPPQPTIIGAWQLGMRTRQMTQKGEMSRRGK
ncbi:MAG: OadG family protein [Chloroflexota bacterium]